MFKDLERPCYSNLAKLTNQQATLARGNHKTSKAAQVQTAKCDAYE